MRRFSICASWHKLAKMTTTRLMDYLWRPKLPDPLRYSYLKTAGKHRCRKVCPRVWGIPAAMALPSTCRNMHLIDPMSLCRAAAPKYPPWSAQ